MRSAFLLGLLAAAVTPSFADDIQLPMPITAEFLMGVQEIPFGKEGARGGARFDAIVERGLTIIPELSELLSDPTVTSNRVPLWGGNYAVGDIAMSAISDIIRVPWLEFITSPDDPQIDTIGFGVYWNFVRESVANRVALKASFERWFSKNEQHLVWRPIPGLETGGVYELPNLEAPTSN